jgi:hypothetical protein
MNQPKNMEYRHLYAYADNNVLTASLKYERIENEAVAQIVNVMFV